MRKESLERKTKETQISINLNLDGSGKSDISTGIGFFDHMLCAFAKHGGFDLEMKVTGDLEVDFHHTIEDCGIALGSLFEKALGDKGGIERFADATVALDEALSRVVVDISGRPYLYFGLDFPRPSDGGGINPWLFEEFFRGFVNNAKLTLSTPAFLSIYAQSSPAIPPPIISTSVDISPDSLSNLGISTPRDHTAFNSLSIFRPFLYSIIIYIIAAEHKNKPVIRFCP